MTEYCKLCAKEREELLSTLFAEYEEYKARGLKLDLSRGKPNSRQLDMSEELLAVKLTGGDSYSQSGEDCRNYGILEGLPEMREFFAELLELKAEDIIVGGNSSLQLMYDTLARAMLFGVYGSDRPWGQEQGLKWLCITPGYDRHFRITETLGFELISVPMRADGPDMDLVEKYALDPKVKGIWCVPKYSNPTGNIYSEEVVRRLVSMKCGAPDFRIMWDNAYAVHGFTEKDSQIDIFAIAEEYGNRDRIFYFSSTSKITFPGAGVAMMAMSENNRRQTLPYLGAQTIGYDKLNQLRHLKHFGTPDKLRFHMIKLGKVIGAKFDIVFNKLSALKGLGIASWTEPEGGYFVSLDTLPGTARRVHSLMKEAGVVLTAAGATHPYGTDPEDKNLRIAPTYPTDAELSLAMDILVLTVKIAALEALSK